MANITDFTEKQFEDRLEKNVERLTKNRLAVESPTAFLLGGQPGSGKTSLRSAISEETQGNVVIIDNDTFKQQHPNFDELVKLYEKDVVKYVTPYSNRMTEAIISRLRDKGYNLVIEGTGRTTDVPIQTATMLQAKDYETKMYVMAVPKINSYLGTIERYETMYADDPMTARATPKQAHDIVVKNLPTNLETLHKTGLFSDIRLYNREGVKLYSSLETPSISPKETLERELNRKVSGKEIQPTLERIEQKMVQNQQVGISFANSVLYAGMLESMDNGSLKKFDVRLANIPGKTKPLSFTYVLGSGVFNTNGEKRMKLAQDFVKFYSENKELVQASMNFLPVRNSIIEIEKDKMPLLETYTNNDKYVVNFSNNTPGYAEIRNALYPEIQAALTGEKTSKEALDAFVEAGDKAIDRGLRRSKALNAQGELEK